jgi:Helix-turn-helix domain
MTFPEWLTIEEYRRVIRVKRGLAYSLANSGTVPARKFGRVWRVHRSALAPPEVPNLASQAANRLLTTEKDRKRTGAYDDWGNSQKA